MRSLYRWEGAIQEDQESVLIVKTRHELMDELTETVKSNHSYECPCIIELPIDGGNPEFLQWIVSETKGGSKNRTDQKSQNQKTQMPLHKIAVIGGDGIGPEVTREACIILSALQDSLPELKFDFKEFDWGSDFF